MVRIYKFTFLVFLLIISSCERIPSDPNSSFDRRQMLDNMARNLIMPSYQNLFSSLEILQNQLSQFINSPSAEVFDSIKVLWKISYADWQYAQHFNFGPAGEEGVSKSLFEEIGTFPVNSTKVNELIESGDLNFNNFQRDSRGLLTIEYLLFRKEALEKMVQDRKVSNYLQAVIQHSISKTKHVLDSWKNGYLNDFIADNSTSVGSSTALLYNEFIRSYEVFKNFKIAVPLGKKAGQTQAEPHLVECNYSGLSLDYLHLHLQSCIDIWHGRNHDGIDGIGFKEYLGSVVGGQNLIESTELQISVLNQVLNALPKNKDLKDLILSEPDTLTALVTESQKLTRFFKSDLSSLLGISITFSSGDGD